MNKRYIDFVPAKKTTGANGGVARVSRTAVAKTGTATRTTRTAVTKTEVVARTSRVATVAPRKATSGVVSGKTTSRVTREIPKPVSGGERKRMVRRTTKTDGPKLGVIEDLAASDLTSSSAVSKQPVLQSAKKEAYKIPKTPFINQNSVTKRPLSKNVYQKKVVTPEEKPKGPVTIISKPEKEKHTSLIITIIVTIILGAAAGTVAFLLLPK